MELAQIRSRAARKLDQLSRAVAVAEHEVTRIAGEKQKLEAAQATDRQEAELYTQAIAALNLLLKLVVTANLKNLTADVNRALKAILPDQDLQFQVNPEIKWGAQVYGFSVKHDGVEHTDCEGIGGTVLTVVSLVLRMMFLLYTKRYPLLVLDESLRMISAAHKERASEFVRQLAHSMGVHTLLITHDQVFAMAADHNYTAKRTEGVDGADGYSTLTETGKSEVAAYFNRDGDEI